MSDASRSDSDDADRRIRDVDFAGRLRHSTGMDAQSSAAYSGLNEGGVLAAAGSSIHDSRLGTAKLAAGQPLQQLYGTGQEVADAMAAYACCHWLQALHPTFD